MTDECPDGFCPAGSRRSHQRSLASRQRRVRVGPGLDEERDHRCAAVRGRKHQWSHVIAIGRIGRSPGLDKRPCCLEIVPMRRPVQRGSPVDGSHVHFATGIEERPDRSEVIRACGANEFRGGAG